MKSYGSYTPSNFLSPAAPLRFTVDSSIEYIRIQNNSSYDLQLEMGGMEQITYPARQLEDIKISQKSGTFNGQITVVPIATVTNISAGTANVLWFYTFTKGELAQPQILQLVAPAVNPTASGKPLFTASFGSGGTTTIGQYLNVFNPPGSGVNMIFHKARVFTNDATFPTVNLYIVPGADLNLGTPVSAVSHSAKVTPPVSAAHCTAVDSGSNFISANTGDIEVMDMQAGVTQDMLAFPDNVVLYPGNNLTMLLVSGTTGHIVRMSLAYTEDIFSPQFGGTNLGTIANQVQNFGNGLVPIVIGGTTNATQVQINTDGSATFTSIQNLPGSNLILKTVNNTDQIQFFSNLTRFLQIDSAGVGFKTIGHIGAGYQLITGQTIATLGTSVLHGLGVIPTVIIPMLDAGASESVVISVNRGTASSAAFTAYSSVNNQGNVCFFVMA